MNILIPSLNKGNIETIKKRIVYPKSQLDYDAAIAESKEALFGKKAQDTFGSELKGVQDGFYKEVAFFTYKNVPLAGRAEALEKAKKDAETKSRRCSKVN